MSKLNLRNRSFTATISSLNAKGNGQTHYEDAQGKDHLVEIPFSLPGDTVAATGRKKVKKSIRCQLDEVLEPSPLRVVPRCKHFGVCGGCRLQQMNYEEQLAYKQKMVEEAFTPLVKEKSTIRSIIASKQQWHYRNKMEFSFNQDKEGNRYLGLMQDSSRKVLNLEECHLVNGWYAKALHVLRRWWEQSGLLAYNPNQDTGSLRVLTLREGMRSGDRLIMLTVSGRSEYALDSACLESFVDSCIEHLTPEGEGRLSIFLRIQQTAKGMPTSFYEMRLYGEEYFREELFVSVSSGRPEEVFRFDISPTAFFQPNPTQAEQLYTQVLHLANLKESDIVYDLYCGTGPMGIFASRVAKQVIGVEVSPESALDAKHNAELNQAENFTVLSTAVRYLGTSAKEGDLYSLLPSVIFIDPPRAGLDPIAYETLVQFSCDRILYVSCNFRTQVEDCKKMFTHGYRIAAIQPVDMFPHTPHVETVVLLEKV
jgi:23S rRNA (uracil1939-C5)-methyltransferase